MVNKEIEMNDKDEHTVTISFVDGYTVYAFRCNAGPESLCRAVYTCDCEEYYDSCIRNGVPAHRPSPFDMDTWHAGVFSAGECSHKDWFDNADDVPLDGEMTFSVNPVWHGGYETFDITTPVLPPSDAETKLAAVRELHKPVDVEPSETICGECSHALPDGTYEPMVDWPCPTIALLDGEVES